MEPKPTTVSELFPSKWLKASDLQGRSFTLTVKRVEMVQVHSPYTGQTEWKAAVIFAEAKKQLLLNVSQARVMAELAGTEVLERWAGLRVALMPGRAKNGKETVLVTKP